MKVWGRSIEDVSRWILFIGLDNASALRGTLSKIDAFTAICDAQADGVGVIISADEERSQRLQTWFRDGGNELPFLLVADQLAMQDRDADVYFFVFPERSSSSPEFYAIGKSAGEVNRAARTLDRDTAEEGAAGA